MVALRKPQTSSPQPTLRLVRDDDYDAAPAGVAPAAPVRLTLAGSDRRVFARRPVSLAVMGRRLDHSIAARRQPALSMTVQDLSVGGLSAVTDTALTPGERIAVNFPTQGLRMGWGTAGRVLRCEPAAAGYRVAVEFEAVPTAA